VEEMRRLVESCHEPWRSINDTLVNVNTCITYAVDKVAGDSDSWLYLNLSNKELFIKTAPEMLVEVFKVLIKNAIEAMPEEATRFMEIRSGLSGDRIEINVTDHGDGIDPQNLDKIFDMRFSTKEDGLGFGLFWTKDYIEGLGGEIRVESVVHRGTTFCITLPPYKEDPNG
jgi:two-component system, NtrC family, nitrogen regulation sensor histidine kinase NtrY